MYNKLFTKILDSSIWLEPTATRVVWLTLIAAMDEDGFAEFAAVGNLAHRARVGMKDAAKAVKCLEEPDKDSSDPDHEGRRIERVNGGWMVLNAPKYREIVSRIVAKEGNRRRVAKYREAHKNGKKPRETKAQKLAKYLAHPDHSGKPLIPANSAKLDPNRGASDEVPE